MNSLSDVCSCCGGVIVSPSDDPLLCLRCLKLLKSTALKIYKDTARYPAVLERLYQRKG